MKDWKVILFTVLFIISGMILFLASTSKLIDCMYILGCMSIAGALAVKEE